MKFSRSNTANPVAQSAPLIWILTSGRRGDIVQCQAVAKGLSDRIEEKTLSPRAPYRWLMPYGPIDPTERALIAPPYPDIIIASGRRSVPYVRALHRATNGTCRVVFMKYPGCDTSKYGLTWCPDHDKRRGDHIISTLTSPHLITEELLVKHRTTIDERIASLPAPRLGIVLGGNNKKVRYDAEEIAAFCQKLKKDLPFKSYVVTGSRRTPPALLKAIEATLAPKPAFIWNNQGDNPYFSILANASALLVTGDSHNLMSEAVASGKAVHVHSPRRNADKFEWFIHSMRQKGFIMDEMADLEPKDITMHNATPDLITKVKRRFSL